MLLPVPKSDTRQIFLCFLENSPSFDHTCPYVSKIKLLPQEINPTFIQQVFVIRWFGVVSEAISYHHQDFAHPVATLHHTVLIRPNRPNSVTFPTS